MSCCSTSRKAFASKKGSSAQTLPSHTSPAQESPLLFFERRWRQALWLGIPVLLFAIGKTFSPGFFEVIEGGSNAVNLLGSSSKWHFSLLLLLFPWGLTLMLLLGPGRFILERGLDSFLKRKLNMFSLLSVGVSSSFLYASISLIVFFVIRYQGSSLLECSREFPSLEGVVLMILLIILGQYLEARGFEKAEKALADLSSWEPLEVTRLKKGEAAASEEVEVDSVKLSEIVVGDHLRIYPGEKIAFDGVLLSPAASIDESMITGEAWPVEKKKGEQLRSGSLNQYHSLVMEVTEVGAKRFLAQLLQTVEKMEQSQVPFQQLTDRVGALFTPIVFIIALITFLGWFFFGGGHDVLANLEVALERMSAVLMIACPCALGMAIPMALSVGGGTAARLGLLFKKAVAIEKLANVGTIAFDKTGTLTEGKPHVVTFSWKRGLTPEERSLYTSYLLAIESQSRPPLAEAIVHFLKESPDELVSAQVGNLEVDQIQTLPGKGVVTTISGKRILVGNRSLLSEEGVGFQLEEVLIRSKTKERVDSEVSDKVRSELFLAVEGKLVLQCRLEDPLKKRAAHVVKKLLQEGYRVALLSGDRQEVVSSVAKQLGIDSSLALGGLLPEEKASWIKNQKKTALGKKEKREIAMLGDGINDTVALAAADIGLSFQAGSDLAQARAEVVFTSPSIEKMLTTLHLSKAILGVMYQNLFLAFAYNIVAIPVATGIFSRWGVGMISPTIGVAAMSLSSLAVIGNALRLAHWKNE